MACMHSRRHGKSGSTRPAQKIAPWVKYKPDEIEGIVAKLAKQGLQSAQIGLALRDQYGIPTVRINNARVARILKANNLYPEIPEDLFNLIRRAVKLSNHLEKSKTDYTSKRGLELTESKIRRLAKYYKGEKALPASWKYTIEEARLLVK